MLVIDRHQLTDNPSEPPRYSRQNGTPFGGEGDRRVVTSPTLSKLTSAALNPEGVGEEPPINL
jgi:hypothetical protein